MFVAKCFKKDIIFESIFSVISNLQFINASFARSLSNANRTFENTWKVIPAPGKV
jgi:hypothetical protein